MTDDRRRETVFILGLVLVTMLAAWLRIHLLSNTPLTTDDCGVASSAFDYMERGHFGATMWQHPKLRNIVTYVSLTLLGGGMWGLKATSLACGILTIPFVGLVSRRLFNSNVIALLGAMFMAVDPVHIDFSRQAIQEVHMPFFSLAAIYAALRYTETNNPFPLLVSGILFGLGLSGKWYVMFPLFVTFLFLAFLIVKRKEDDPDYRWWPDLLLLLSTGVVVPATVYLATYLPWFWYRGYDLSEWLMSQRFMYHEALTHEGFNKVTALIDPNAKLWFLKPVAYADFVFSSGKPVILLAVSNPLVWMAVLPASLHLLWKGVKEKNRQALFVSALFWSSYLPLALAGRPIWVNTSLAVIPFAFMTVAYSLVSLLQGKKYGRKIVAAYMAATMVVAAPLYLLAIGKGFDNPLLRPIVELYRPADER